MISLICIFLYRNSPKQQHNPILLVPGFFDSQIEASYNRKSAYWFCPSKGSKEWKFFNLMSWLPPFFYCNAELFRCHYNNATNEIIDAENVSLSVIDFGGVKGIEKVLRLPGGLRVSSIYREYIRQLEKDSGYIVKKDLFGVPYDWRYGLAQKDTFWESFQKVVEESYDKNNNKKVVIISHSQGCHITAEFLTSKTTKEWRKKYIKRVALLAPAMGGMGQALAYVWQGGVPILPWVKISLLAETIRSFPGFLTLFPNFEIFGETPIFYGENGEPITAKMVPDYFFKYGIFEGENKQIMEKSIQYLKTVPPELDVETLIYYNSNFKTFHGMNFTTPGILPAKSIDIPGDGYVPAIGAEYICRKWRNNHQIRCFDIKDDIQHADFLTKPKIAKRILDWANSENVNKCYEKGLF